MSRRIYLDTNAVIRFIESREDQIASLFAGVASGKVDLFTSELTLAEALVGAYKLGDDDLVEAYEGFLRTDEVMTVVMVSRAVLTQSAKLRADFGGKTPDSIHIATAILANCDIIISSDQRLRLPEGLSRVAVDDIDKRDDLR